MNFKHCRDAGLAVAVLLLTTACAREEASAPATADGGLDRTVLPIHEPACRPRSRSSTPGTPRRRRAST